MKFVHILDIPFIHIDQKDFVTLLDKHVEEKQKAFVITANPEVVMKAKDEPGFNTIVNQATYVVADGIGVVKAAKLLNQPLPGRVTGFDTMMKLLDVSNRKQYKIYLLGAKKGTLHKAIDKIKADYPNIDIVGSHDGYFDWEQNSIAEEIKRTKPDLVFVALGVPKQEKWIAEHFQHFEHGIFMGVGGSFDVLAGEVKRAPETWQKLNLEWLYRLLKQPTRFRRMLALPRFVFHVLLQKIKGN